MIIAGMMEFYYDKTKLRMIRVSIEILLLSLLFQQ